MAGESRLSILYGQFEGEPPFVIHEGANSDCVTIGDSIRRIGSEPFIYYIKWAAEVADPEGSQGNIP